MPSFSRQSSGLNNGAAFGQRNCVVEQASVYHPSIAGRKRSRDEASTNLNDDEPPQAIDIEPIQESEDDWIYGEGMVLIKANSGYVADASSQSGTWVEEKAEEVARKVKESLLAEQVDRERPSLRSHKSQRLDSTAHPSASQEFLPTGTASSESKASPQILPTICDTASQPVVDDFTLHLGIGWSRISDDAHIQAAARGWSRFIENRYPLSEVRIRLESKGLQSYLVEAAEGYFLFSEDLRQGRLVSTNADRALENLRSAPPIFDGPETLRAAETPKPVEPSTSNVGMTSSGDTDMDLS